MERRLGRGPDEHARIASDKIPHPRMGVCCPSIPKPALGEAMVARNRCAESPRLKTAQPILSVVLERCETFSKQASVVNSQMCLRSCKKSD
jgi:hypothetical protein